MKRQSNVWNDLQSDRRQNISSLPAETRLLTGLLLHHIFGWEESSHMSIIAKM